MPDKQRPDFTAGINQLLVGLEKTAPGLGMSEKEVMGNALLSQIGKALKSGERLASVKFKKDGNLDLKVWHIGEIDEISTPKDSGVAISSTEPSIYSVLRIELDGKWSLENMRLFFSYIQDIYNFGLTLELMRNLKEKADIIFDSTDERGRLAILTGSPWIIPKESSLQIQRIQYGSPGITDIAGLGIIIGHLKDFLIKVIELGVAKEQRKLENQERALNNQRLQIENVQSVIKLAKELGYSKSELKQLHNWVSIRNDGLVALTSEGKIKSVEILSKE